MGALLKQLWTDPTYFASTMRGSLATLGAFAATGALGANSKYGLFLMALSQFINAGQKNPT